MERLSGLDASFLYLESPQQLMHVCGLILLDPSTMATSYDFDSFKARLEARVREIPMFTRKLRRVPLYFLGARIDGLYPLGPIFHGAGLNITVMSNNGQMHVGIIGCRESIPRVWDLAADFPAELDALYAAAVG